MTNFLEETKQEMAKWEKTPEDIRFIGSADRVYGCSWEEFEQLADFEYDSGFGGQEIPTDLIIVFDGGTWMERQEYDGSEWWAVKVPPLPFITKTKSIEHIKSPYGDSWFTLEEAHKEGGKFGYDD